MAALVSSLIFATRASEEKRGVQAQIVYSVKMDNPTVGQQVIEAAQAASSGDRVQRINETMDVTIDSVQHIDNAVEVDSISAVQSKPGAEGRLHWKVTVTYKSPSLRSIGVPFDESLDPLGRAAEFWTETLIMTEERKYGENLQAIRWPWNTGATGPPPTRAKNTVGPVTNSAGFRYGGLPVLQKRLPIFVIKRNVRNPFAWISINNDFEAQSNADEWDVFDTGQTVSVRTCMFLSIETSRPKYWGGEVYYELECRVLYNQDGHDIKVPDIGDKVWRSFERAGRTEWVLDTPSAGGIPAQPPIFLDGDGQLRESQAGFADDLTFRDLEVKNFSSLNNRVRSLE